LRTSVQDLQSRIKLTQPIDVTISQECLQGLSLGYHWLRKIVDLKKRVGDAIPNPMIADRLLTRIEDELSFSWNIPLLGGETTLIGRVKTRKPRPPIPAENQIHDSDFKDVQVESNNRSSQAQQYSDPGSTLSCHNIQKESTLHLVLRLGRDMKEEQPILPVITPDYQASSFRALLVFSILNLNTSHNLGLSQENWTILKSVEDFAETLDVRKAMRLPLESVVRCIYDWNALFPDEFAEQVQLLRSFLDAAPFDDIIASRHQFEELTRVVIFMESVRLKIDKSLWPGSAFGDNPGVFRE
jgi:hypothetical protein